MNSLSPAQLMRYLRILRADLPRIAKGETPATDLLEWPSDVLEFMWRRVCPLHDHQLPPERATWTTWLVLGGRGAGKTRAGAEWVTRPRRRLRLADRESRVGRIALVGETFADARDVMIEGPSGLLASTPPGERPRWSPSLRRLEWPNGAVAHVFSAEDPDTPARAAVRGRLVRRARESGAMPRRPGTCCSSACGSGARPRQVVTTTPRPIPLLRRLLADRARRQTRARTADNASNLAPAFLDDGGRAATPARGSAARSSTAS